MTSKESTSRFEEWTIRTGEKLGRRFGRFLRTKTPRLARWLLRFAYRLGYEDSSWKQDTYPKSH